jgi:hypothetical protein
MAQQTAVEWLIDRLLDGSLRFEETKMGFLISMNNDEIEEAKAMEKSTIMAAYMRGSADTTKLINLELITIAEEYYNETYNK